MRSPARIAVLAAVFGALLLAPAAAGAQTRTLTLFSKPITAGPYVAEQEYMPLAPNGKEAPDFPGWITRMDADVVRTPDAGAKTLSIQDVMIHHLVYFHDGVTNGQANCGGRFFGRGEERQVFDFPKGYGVPNRTAGGKAPGWMLTHMLMNHRSYAQTVYVRIRVTYTTEPQKDLTPLWIDTKGCDFDPVYDVPGGGKKGSDSSDTRNWTAPFDGRIVAAGGHLHGGGKRIELRDTSCSNRLLVNSKAYYGKPRHIFYRVRPILHEPSPIRIGIYTTAQGIPVSQGDVLSSEAVYDNSHLHGRVMNIMLGYMTREPVPKCGSLPTDLRLVNKPKHFRRSPPRFVVPLNTKPRGPWKPVSQGPGSVTDFLFTPQRLTAKPGQPVTWDFRGTTLHNVTVANGPRGFSSRWTGYGGTFTYAPQVKGTYQIFCSLHPYRMTQVLKVR